MIRRERLINDQNKYLFLITDHHGCSTTSLRFSQFSGCWLLLSVYILLSFDFWKIVRSSVILLWPLYLFLIADHHECQTTNNSSNNTLILIWWFIKQTNHKLDKIAIRRVGRYQRGNYNPHREEQTTPWPKEKVENTKTINKTYI
jgi:hypothetical protein